MKWRINNGFDKFIEGKAAFSLSMCEKKPCTIYNTVRYYKGKDEN